MNGIDDSESHQAKEISPRPLSDHMVSVTNTNNRESSDESQAQTQSRLSEAATGESSPHTDRLDPMADHKEALELMVERGDGRPKLAVSIDTEPPGEPALETTNIDFEASDLPSLDRGVADVPSGSHISTEPSDRTVGNIHQHKIATDPDYSVVRLIEQADHSAGRLVNLLTKHFPSIRDDSRFERRTVKFLKRAQILVADVWAALNGTGWGEFHDIDHLTMFAGE